MASRPSVSWPNGGTRGHRAARAQVLREDGWLCRMREFRDGEYIHPRMDPAARLRATVVVSPNCTGDAVSQLQAHHLLGRRVTGDDPAWMLTACKSCNQATGDPTDGEPEPTVVRAW